MLNEKFLSRMGAAWPEFYPRVDEEARADAARLRLATGGDISKALTRARVEAAGRMWWPYVKGSVPFVQRERAAMEGFARLVLTVDHLVGYDAGGMEKAREHVVGVLRQSLDIERLKDLIAKKDEEAKAAAAGAGLVASAGALLAPLTTARTLWSGARRWGRWLPPPVKVAAAVVIVSALASVPIVATLSAGHKAEQAARGATMPIEKVGPSDDVTRAA